MDQCGSMSSALTQVRPIQPIEDYCAWAYNPEFLENCRNDQGVAIWEIAHYRGSNAFAQHSRNRSTPTQSFVIGNPAGLGPGDGAKISAHEYVHIYTAAHQLYNAADRYGLRLANLAGRRRSRVPCVISRRSKRMDVFSRTDD